MTEISNSQIVLICFLTEAIFFGGLWLWDDYMASLLSIVLPSICLAILLISIIAEMLERSNVPRLYYLIMVVLILTPIVIGLFYLYIMDGYVEWFYQ